MKKNETKLHRIIGIVLNITLIIAILYIIVTLYLRATTSNPHASLFGFTTHIVISESMEPTIKKNDIIIVKRSDRYNIGDIITYISEDGLSITHRIISSNPDGYILKGDANSEQDPGIITYDQIVGKAIILIPYNGDWISFV